MPHAAQAGKTGSARLEATRETPLSLPSDELQPAEVDSADDSRYAVGELIDERYRLLSQLGKGGMGEVWLAEQRNLKSKVAIKFLNKAAASSLDRHLVRERFMFEAQVSAQLGSKTDHIVRVLDAGADERGPFLVMEYVEGKTMADLLDAGGRFSMQQLADILTQLEQALTIAHDAGIVHRDIKPSNLILIPTTDGRYVAKLADFGIAKANMSGLRVDRPRDTQAGTFVGSPPYTSPEQLRRGEVDGRSDAWAIGVVFYEALTGVIPFSADLDLEIIINVMTKTFDPPSKLNPSLSALVDAFFERALARDREDRFQSVAEMATAFRALAAVGSDAGPLSDALRFSRASLAGAGFRTSVAPVERISVTTLAPSRMSLPTLAATAAAPARRYRAVLGAGAAALVLIAAGAGIALRGDQLPDRAASFGQLAQTRFKAVAATVPAEPSAPPEAGAPPSSPPRAGRTAKPRQTAETTEPAASPPGTPPAQNRRSTSKPRDPSGTF